MTTLPLDPLTRKKIHRFRSIKRGYYSAIFLAAAILLSFGAELFVNSRALIVRYEGRFHFPTYGSILPGTTFGLDYRYETKYRELKRKFKAEGRGNWVLLPPAPYNAYENDLTEGIYPPTAPDAGSGHWLGTDSTGRDVLARLVYGFRTAIVFSILLLLCNYTIGVTIGCAMGYFGGEIRPVLPAHHRDLGERAVSLHHHHRRVDHDPEFLHVDDDHALLRLDSDDLVHAHGHL